MNPRLIVEILSDTNESDDRVEKFGENREIASLQEYVLVSQHEAVVETFVRQNDGSWRFEGHTGINAAATLRSLRSLSVELKLIDVFAGVEFPPEPDWRSLPRP